MKMLVTSKGVIDKVLMTFSVALFMILVAVVSWQVFARQILDEPSQWSETLSRYLFIWVGLLGTAVVFGERGHIAIDVIVRRLPRVAQKVVALLVQVLVIGFSGYVLVWGGARAAENAWAQNLSGLPTSIGPWYLVMPLAGVVIIFYSLYHMIGVVKGDEEPFSADITEPV